MIQSTHSFVRLQSKNPWLNKRWGINMFQTGTYLLACIRNQMKKLCIKTLQRFRIAFSTNGKRERFVLSVSQIRRWNISTSFINEPELFLEIINSVQRSTEEDLPDHLLGSIWRLPVTENVILKSLQLVHIIRKKIVIEMLNERLQENTKTRVTKFFSK